MVCAANVYCQYDKSFDNAQTMKMDLLNKFQSLILTKGLLKLSKEVNKPSNKPSNNSISSMHVLFFFPKEKNPAVSVA